MNTPPKKSLADLVAVMAALRTPGTGCPWDLAQTFRTIAPYTIEEAYEVADAIERDEMGELRDELGDLLLQVVYHARMAEEAGAFGFDDVADAITRKMIRRHPHVFGTPEQKAAGAAPGFWERIKAKEKTDKTAASSGGLLDDVPVGMAALTRAVKLQSKAAKVGFDWPSLALVFDKMREELAELEAVALPADPRGECETVNRAAIEEEFGDLLFVMANVARHLAIDPEAALRAASQKFSRRFRHIERRLAEQGRTPQQSDLAEMDRLWDEAKVEDHGPVERAADKPPSFKR